ncbi:MAG: DUF1549 domain-containing protein [Planctomycetales bacterium]|nr:DUF1549 domain-containing protein [Planctomycetales bacterium]
MQDHPSDQILEAFLEEMLAGQTPPDLIQRVKVAWQAENLRAGDSDVDTVAELIEIPDPSALPGPVSCNGTHRSLHDMELATSARHQRAELTAAQAQVAKAEPSADRINDTNHSASRYRSISRTRRQVKFGLRTWSLTLVGVAAAFLALLNWNGYFSSSPTPEPVAERRENNTRPENSAQTGGAAATELATENSGGPETAPAIALDHAPVLEPKIAEGGRESAVPLSRELEIAQAAPTLSASEEERQDDENPPSVLIAKPDAQVVSDIDNQLKSMWQDLGIAPTPEIGDAQFVARVNSALFASLELPLPRTVARVGVDRSALVKSALEQREFADHLATQLIGTWLRNTGVDMASPEVIRLRRSVADQIESSEPWNEIIVDLLGGQLVEGAPSETFLGGLAGNGNQRLLERLGTHFLNMNLACVRCHDSMASDDLDPSDRVTQEVYWSTLAMLKGIGIQGRRNDGNDPLRVFDRQELLAQSDQFFADYELLDNRMRSVSARLPDGTPWTRDGSDLLPRQSLSQWIANSQRMDLATVNQVWCFLLGRPLVPQVSAVETVGLPQRKQLLTMLATQYRLNGRSIRRLTGWIAASVAFDRSQPSLSGDQWLLANDEQLEQLKISELTFAAASTNQSRSLSNAINLAIQWRSQGELNSALLAQPAPRDPGRTPRERERVARELMPPLDFAIHAEQSTSAQQAYLRRLATSTQLDWQQQVNHVLLLRPALTVNARIQQLAQTLLEKNSGNREETLLDLLWSVEASCPM